MPIYEFYCEPCHTVFTFFSRRVNTDRSPACPSCGSPPLRRQVSLFSSIKRRGEENEKGGDLPIDEGKMERAMAMLAQEAGTISEDDPRAAARLMRKLSDTAGVSLGGAMEEALIRMERGEEPEAIEDEMGDLPEGEEFPGFGPTTRGRASRKPRPKIDETLYEM